MPWNRAPGRRERAGRRPDEETAGAGRLQAAELWNNGGVPVHDPRRRAFLGASALALPGWLVGRWTPGAQGEGFAQAPGAPAIVTSERLRPQLPGGIQSGDVTASRAVVWSRTDRPARMLVEWDTDDAFRTARRVTGPAALEHTGFTAAVDLRGLPAGADLVYRIRFESLSSPGALSEPLTGRLRTAPEDARRLRLVWTGDTVGQGWGIDRARGGLRMYRTMLDAAPDVFVHSGDLIYADGPLAREVRLDDGTLWRNEVTPAKAKVAETLEEFRGNFQYTMLDEHARRFHAAVPLIAQWDDHEVVNNWFPGLQLDDDARYTVKSASLLAARAKQAFFEHVPLRRSPDESERIYRQFAYGPLLDVFVIDLRSYRGPNTFNRQAAAGADTAFAGGEQLAWLKAALAGSKATWKVVASDMPIGLVVPDRERRGEPNFEAWANADPGQPAGRELELADLLAHLQRERVRNVVWITADVHYAAAHHYAPDRAAFTAFDPFWEFVAGPMHAGTFGPNALDATFGPEVRFASVEAGMAPNRPPSDDRQYFGVLDIDPATRTLTVDLRDVTGRSLWTRDLQPVGP